VERSTWTDARLDDRFDRIDRRFDRVDRDIAELRTEMRAGFGELRQAIFRMYVSMIAGMAALLAAILARGA
jgi:hypothetical protein